MSWKPYRGSGAGFENALDREREYRAQIVEKLQNPGSIKQYSKLYYHWLVAERDIRNDCSTYRITIGDLYGRLLPPNILEQFAQHKEQCYKPLQKYIK